MALEPLEIEDTEAEKRLIAILDRAKVVLETLGEEPILVAECPNKFNDAFWDDRWFAAQVGPACWEQAQYLEGRTEPLVQEKGRHETSKGIRAARRVLNELEAAGWRNELRACLGADSVNSGDVICLALQYGQPWICSASSNDVTGVACTWVPSHGLVHVARCDRIDQSIGDVHPIRFRELRPDTWWYLAPKARAYFCPEIGDRVAEKGLCDLLRKATDKVRRTTATTEPVILQASNSLRAANLYRGQPLIRRASEWGPSTVNALKDAPMRWSKTATKTFEKLSDILGDMEGSGWRELFAKTIGLLKDGDLLCLVVKDGQPILIWELTAFDFTSGELRIMGLCNRLDISNANFQLEFYPIGP